jgi:hypothetical protein
MHFKKIIIFFLGPVLCFLSPESIRIQKKKCLDFIQTFKIYNAMDSYQKTATFSEEILIWHYKMHFGKIYHIFPWSSYLFSFSRLGSWIKAHLYEVEDDIYDIKKLKYVKII